MALQVDTVFVWVTDLDRSVEWYASLGIEPGPRYGAWQNMAVDGKVRFALHLGDRPQGRATGAVASVWTTSTLNSNVLPAWALNRRTLQQLIPALPDSPLSVTPTATTSSYWNALDPQVSHFGNIANHLGSSS